MPRLGLSFSSNFAKTKTKPNTYGRRIRNVEGVRIVGEREPSPALGALFFKVASILALLALAAMAVAIWRLFNFPH
jgi:hypothetical protein